MNSSLKAQTPHREAIYWPEKRPGFVAWTTAFDYGDGRIGLSFSETLIRKNEHYVPPRLEASEVMGTPVSYCSVFHGNPEQSSCRVYLSSSDNGKTWAETGRCPLKKGSFCNVGFPDGRILGMGAAGFEGEPWGGIHIRESRDGGSTWTHVTRLLPETANYVWRVRRLRDGTIVLLSCFYGTPWGERFERTSRNTMLPGERYIDKIQTYFLTSKDGVEWSEPHYVLPGVGAHEYDCAELPDGRLLFLTGDVQGTPVARQIVTRTPGGWVNGTIYGIRRGAPPDPLKNPQGGFVPETFVMTADGLLVGSRRNKPYSCSNDFGENWFELDGLAPSLYQPFMQLLPDGGIANFGHRGGDQGFGQEDMFIGADLFRVENILPQATRLTLRRELSPDGSHYENRYAATLTAGGRPIAGQALRFRFRPNWDKEGASSTLPADESPIQLEAVTDESGTARVHVAEYDGIGDIHFSYFSDVVFRPSEDSGFLPCDGPSIAGMALRPHRETRWPYDAYFAEGSLFLSPALVEEYPDLYEKLKPLCGLPGDELPADTLPEGAVERLLNSGVLRRSGRKLCWLHSVHAPTPLAKVLPMSEGDWYL